MTPGNRDIKNYKSHHLLKNIVMSFSDINFFVCSFKKI